MPEDDVKNAVIKWLSSHGWGHFKYDKLHTHGVDVRARRIGYSRYFFIETKGQGKNRSSSEVAFIYSLGQVVTRMKDSGSTRNYYGLALPNRSAQIAIRRIPWQVANKLLLHIFSVTTDGEVTHYAPSDIKKHQTKT